MAFARCIAGFFVFLSSAALANEADDTIRRLVGEARAYAVARSPAGLSKTLFEIAKVLPDASDDGIAAVNELSKYLDNPTTIRPGQGATPPAAPTPAAPLLPPIESQPAQQSEPPARKSAAKPQQLPPAPAAPAPASPAPVLLAPAPAPSSPAPVPPAVPAMAVAPQASAALLDLLRRQGAAALGNGDISGARRFYQRGAEAGCAPCAEGMAQTFDPEQLSRIGAIGIRPDPAQAEAWRVRARQLARTGTP